jgi:pimeloyl-ACP methyl ester carboxylesterase
MKSTLLLVHGAWHGAWCWDAVIDALGPDAAITVDLPGHGSSDRPLGDLASDVATVVAAAEAIDGGVTLVGHSYGGMVITNAATHLHRLDRLIFLAAYRPHLGDSLSELSAQIPGDAADTLVFSDDFSTVRLNPGLAAPVFYNDCSDDDIAAALPRLSAQAMVTFTTPSEEDASRLEVPQTYIRCTQDHAVPLALQEQMSTDVDDIVTLESGHSPFFSMPDALAEALTARR